MDKMVIAVIGCGRLGGGTHMPHLNNIKGVYVKYACDIILSKAEAVKAKYPELIGEAISDYKIALNDKEVEAVFVITPNQTHYTITMDALKAGKHVFCEKPITVNYELSKEMADFANKQGLMLNIGVCNRYNKSVQILEQMNKKGMFGNIYHIVCSFRKYRMIPGLGGSFTDKKQSGGGVLIDWGVHFFDLILYILGGAKIKTVTCDAYCEMAKNIKDYKYTYMWAEDTKDEKGVNDVDDMISGYIRTDKASISFNGAWAQNVDKDEMYIDFLGDKGGARLDYGGNFTYYTQDEIGGLKTVQYTFNIPNMYETEQEAFFESIRSGVKNKEHIDDVLESAKLLQALYDSAEIKKEISF